MRLSSSCNGTSCASQVQPKHQGICPDGWHIPSKADWEELVAYIEGEIGCGTGRAGKFLKATEGWPGENDNEDEYGFAALPGGSGWSNGFSGFHSDGYWWSSTEYGAGRPADAYYINITSGGDSVYMNDQAKPSMNSVRCIKD